MSTFGFQFTKMMSVQLVKWSTPPSAPPPLEEARLPRVCVQKLTELIMTRQEQKWLVRPSILHALLLYQMWRCGGFEFANQYSTPHVHSLYRTKCHFKSWWFVQSSLVVFVKKKSIKNLVFKYICIYSYTGSFFKISFDSTKCLQMQFLKPCTWCTVWVTLPLINWKAGAFISSTF